MRHLTRNIILILVVLIIAGLSIFPPDKNLRLGKDLAGGVSLTYTVDVPEDEQADVVVPRVISVLSERVNPQGLFEISFVRQGRDRLVVSMPLPSESVQQYRDAYDEAVEALDAYAIDPAAFERAMRQEGQARIDRLRAMADTAGRQSILDPVIDAAIEAREARQEFEAQRAIREAGGEPTADLDQLESAAAAADIAFDDARARVFELSVSAEDLRQALARPDETVSLPAGDGSGDNLEVDSERKRALDAIRAKLEQLPDGVETLERALEAFDAYAENRSGLDDPADLERLLQGSGVLEYRIVPEQAEVPGDIEELRRQLRERGPDALEVPGFVWLPINKPTDWTQTYPQYESLLEDPEAFFASQGIIAGYRPADNQIYLLLFDRPGKRLTDAEGDWALASSLPTTDQLGRRAIGFRMDPRGGERMGELTGNNLQKQMAVILDGRVYSAPNIQGRITRNGIIQGQFSQRELNYIIRTLNAGSLQASLSDEPISRSVLAPELGADNLDKGLTAAVIALILVGSFMVLYYFTGGVVALIALACNAVIILGVMSLNRAAFTLPGIAGIVLTFGMAVDANVLIYERLREELLAGNDTKTALRLAYQKVLSTIVDANVTNLIICLVLGYTATQEIKGFAITLGVGVVATMFSALLITRVVFAVLVDKIGWKNLSQLPIAIPFIDRLLTPNIDWIKFRPVFVVISALLIAMGIGFIVVQQDELLDTEFRGGTQLDLNLRDPGPGFSGTMTREEVAARIQDEVYQPAFELVNAQSADVDEDQLAEAQELLALQNAEVQAVNPQADGVTSDRFQIKTTSTDTGVLRDAIVNAFADVVDSQPALTFRASDEEEFNAPGVPVFPILSNNLGDNFQPEAPEIRNDVTAYVGGVAVLLDDIRAPGGERVSKQSIEERIAYIRRQAAYAGPALNRDVNVVVLEGTDEAVERVAVVVSDVSANARVDVTRWENVLASSEWNITRDALASAQELAGVESFSPEVAATFRNQAIVAVVLSFMLITMYIWARFGSVRYSLAALACLVHDVIIAIGLIAMAEFVYKRFPGVAAIGIQPFKIDLGLIAAILTIIGYSLNDTIIILDRIRENRGRLAYASREVVNKSINQTVSRTLITSGTTIVALAVMFVVGGEGIASFTYALLCGVVVGTYSSIAVGAPLVWTKKIPKAAQAYYNRYSDEAAAQRAAERDHERGALSQP